MEAINLHTLTIDRFIDEFKELNTAQGCYNVIDDDMLYKILYRLTERFNEEKVQEFFSYLPIHDICSNEIDARTLFKEQNEYPLFYKMWEIIKKGDNKTYNPEKIKLTFDDINKLWSWRDYIRSVLYNQDGTLKANRETAISGFKLTQKAIKEYGDFLIDAEILKGELEPLLDIRRIYTKVSPLYDLLANDKSMSTNTGCLGQYKPKGRPRRPFIKLLLHEHGSDALSSLHKLLSNQSNKEFALTIKALINHGVINKPTYKEAITEFGGKCSRSLYNKYLGGYNPSEEEKEAKKAQLKRYGLIED